MDWYGCGVYSPTASFTQFIVRETFLTMFSKCLFAFKLCVPFKILLMTSMDTIRVRIVSGVGCTGRKDIETLHQKTIRLNE